MSESSNTEFDNESFVTKTLLGRNAEFKRITELSHTRIEDLTGIPHEEMFGTEETGEKVLYVGAPYQAKEIFDSERLFVVDYEYAEIANFVKSYDVLEKRLEELMFDDYRVNSLNTYHQELAEHEDDPSITAFERTWYSSLFPTAETILKDISLLRSQQHQGRAEADAHAEVLAKIRQLKETLRKREEEEKDIITERKRTYDQRMENSEYISGFDVYDLERYQERLYEFAKKAEQGLKNIEDYQTVVVPKLDEYHASLLDENPNISEAEQRLKMKQEELHILTMMLLKKQTEKSHIVVAMFPNLPFREGSMDRVIFSYSLSTHGIPEASPDDFRSWWKEIQRVLKPGGKAYMFPMQQGFPYGREYDEYALVDTLDEFSHKQGGQLRYDFFENPNEKAWRQDTTLIITKEIDGEKSSPKPGLPSSVLREISKIPDLEGDTGMQFATQYGEDLKPFFPENPGEDIWVKCLIAPSFQDGLAAILLPTDKKVIDEYARRRIAYNHPEIYTEWRGLAFKNLQSKRASLYKSLPNYDSLLHGYVRIIPQKEKNDDATLLKPRTILYTDLKSHALDPVEFGKKLRIYGLDEVHDLYDKRIAAKIEQLVRDDMYMQPIEQTARRLADFITSDKVEIYKRLARQFYIERTIEPYSPRYNYLKELENVGKGEEKDE